MIAGVIDSGVGGLSICASIRRKLPDLSLVFCGDSDFYPYGTKEESVVSERVLSLALALCKREHLDLLVVGCNTASTVVLPLLRERLSIPIVGVVPAIKPAALLSKTGVIGLLATPATVSRKYTDDLIGDFAADRQIVRIGSSRLVELAEDKMHGRPFQAAEVCSEIAPFFNQGGSLPDVIVLGCTHFPILRDELEQCFKQSKVQWLDSNEAVAERVKVLLKEMIVAKGAATHKKPSKNTYKALFTRALPKDSKLAARLERLHYQIGLLEMDSPAAP